MKKSLLFIFSFCISIALQAQVSKTVNVVTPGTLDSLLTSTEDTTVTNLTITGSINDNDFTTIRILMNALKVLNLSGATCTSIPDEAFSGCTNLTSITIPNLVTSIGIEAFNGCSSITSINIPSSVKSIGIDAFNDCSSITSINIPSSVTSIGYGAFNQCNSLTSITIPSLVKSIGSGTFFGCIKLESIIFTIPSSITSIGQMAFYNCSTLTSITIPTLDTLIGAYAFSGCSSLTSITIPSSVSSIGGSAFYGCNDLTSINIPSSLTSIGEMTFARCSGLRSISIPLSVTSIGSLAFSGCSDLTSIYDYSTIPINLPSSILDLPFGSVNKSKCTLYVPTVSINRYKDSLQWRDFQHIRGLTGFTVSDTNISPYWPYQPHQPLYIHNFSNNALTVSSNQSWLTTNLTSIESDTILTFKATINPTSSPRTAIITISGDGISSQSITISQPGAMLSINMDTVRIANKANSTAYKYINSNTNWFASSNQSWLVATPNTSLGSEILNFTASVNLTTAPRTAIVTVMANGVPSQTITIIQDAGYILDVSSNTINIAKDAGSSATINVTSNGTWKASSLQTWLFVNPTESTNGNSTLTLMATENTGVARTDTINVSITGGATQTIVVTQESSSSTANLLVSSNTATIPQNSPNATILNVTTSSTWSASSSAPTWLVVTQSTTSGNGTISILATTNTTGDARTATITITTANGTQTITVTQVSSGTETGFTEINNDAIINYPNPATSFFNINMEGEALVQVYNLGGELVLSKKTSCKENISTNNIPAGLYIVKIITRESNTTLSLVVKQ